MEFDARQDLHAARQILILPRLTNAVGLYKARMVGCASRNLLQ